MKFQFNPKNASSNEFIPSIDNRILITSDFISNIDVLDISFLNGKKFLVACSAGDSASDEVISSSIKDNLALEEALAYAFSIRNDQYFFPKMFILDGESIYLLDPLSTEVFATDPTYYADSMGGFIFPENKDFMVPGICKLDKKPMSGLNTIVTYDNGQMELVKALDNKNEQK